MADEHPLFAFLRLLLKVVKAAVEFTLDLISIACLAAAFVAPWRATHLLYILREDYWDNKERKCLGPFHLLASLIDLVAVPCGLVALLLPTRTRIVCKDIFDADENEPGNEHYDFGLRIKFVQNLVLGLWDLPFVAIGIFLPAMAPWRGIELWRGIRVIVDVQEGRSQLRSLRVWVRLQLYYAALDAFSFVCAPFGLLFPTRALFCWRALARTLRKAPSSLEFHCISQGEALLEQRLCRVPQTDWEGLRDTLVINSIVALVDVVLIPFAMFSIVSVVRCPSFIRSMHSAAVTKRDENDMLRTLEYEPKLRWLILFNAVAAVVDLALFPFLVLALLSIRCPSLIKALRVATAEYVDNDELNYNQKVRSIIFSEGCLAITDAFLLPLLLPVAVTAYRFPPIMVRIRGADGNVDFHTRVEIIIQFALIFLDVMLAPIALIVCVSYRGTDVRSILWRSRRCCAFDSSDGSAEQPNPQPDDQIEEQQSDTSFIVNPHISGQPPRQSRGFQKEEADCFGSRGRLYYHFTVLYNAMILLHDLFLLLGISVGLCVAIFSLNFYRVFTTLAKLRQSAPSNAVDSVSHDWERRGSLWKQLLFTWLDLPFVFLSWLVLITVWRADLLVREVRKLHFDNEGRDRFSERNQSKRRLAAARHFGLMVRDILCLPLFAVVLASFYKGIPLLLSLYIKTRHVPRSEPEMHVQRAHLRVKNCKGGELNLHLRPLTAAGGSPSHCGLRLRILGENFWDAAGEAFGATLVSVAQSQLPVQLVDSSVDSHSAKLTLHSSVKSSTLAKKLRLMQRYGNGDLAMALQLEAKRSGCWVVVALFVLPVKDLITAATESSVVEVAQTTEVVSVLGGDAEDDPGAMRNSFYILTIISFGAVVVDVAHFVLALILLVVAPWRGVSSIVVINEPQTRLSTRVSQKALSNIKHLDGAMSTAIAELVPSCNEHVKQNMVKGVTGHSFLLKLARHCDKIRRKELGFIYSEMERKVRNAMVGLDPPPPTHVLLIRLLDLKLARHHFLLLAARLHVALLNGLISDQFHAACIERTRRANRSFLTAENTTRTEMLREQALLEARTLRPVKISKWGFWHKTNTVNRSILRSMAMQATIDYAVLLLLLLLLLSGYRFVLLVSRLYERTGLSFTLRPTSQTVRLEVIRQVLFLYSDLYYLVSTGLGCVAVALLVVRLPRLPLLFIQTTSLRELNARVWDMAETSLANLCEVFVLLFAWDTYKLAARAALFSFFVPAAALDEILRMLFGGSEQLRFNLSLLFWAGLVALTAVVSSQSIIRFPIGIAVVGCTCITIAVAGLAAIAVGDPRSTSIRWMNIAPCVSAERNETTVAVRLMRWHNILALASLILISPAQLVAATVWAYRDDDFDGKYRSAAILLGVGWGPTVKILSWTSVALACIWIGVITIPIVLERREEISPAEGHSGYRLVMALLRECLSGALVVNLACTASYGADIVTRASSLEALVAFVLTALILDPEAAIENASTVDIGLDVRSPRLLNYGTRFARLLILMAGVARFPLGTLAGATALLIWEVLWWARRGKATSSVAWLPPLRVAGACAPVFTAAAAAITKDAEHVSNGMGLATIQACGAGCIFVVGGAVAIGLQVAASRERMRRLAASGLRIAVEGLLEVQGQLSVDEALSQRWLLLGKNMQNCARDTWSAELATARTPRRLARSLLTFERYVLCERLETDFLRNRETWIAGLNDPRVSFRTVRESVDMLHGSIRSPPFLVELAKLLRRIAVLRWGIDHFVAFRILSYVVDVDAANTVFERCLCCTPAHHGNKLMMAHAERVNQSFDVMMSVLMDKKSGRLDEDHDSTEEMALGLRSADRIPVQLNRSGPEVIVGRPHFKPMFCGEAFVVGEETSLSERARRREACLHRRLHEVLS